MKSKLVEGEDYYFDERGMYVFTAAFHQKRGYCCGSGCKHCPYPREDFEAARRKRSIFGLFQSKK